MALKIQHFKMDRRFLVYINDLNEYIKNSTIELFADGSIIYKTIRNKETK